MPKLAALMKTRPARLRAQLDKLPAGEQREELGPEWLGACVNVGRAKFAMAMAIDPGSDQRQELLTDAATQCGGLYQKYSKRLGGAIAHFYEGRCYQELGKRKEALAAYSDLIADLTGDDAAPRLLKTQAIKQAQQLWLEDEDFKSVAETAAWAKERGRGTSKSGLVGSQIIRSDWIERIGRQLETGCTLSRLFARRPRELASDVLKSKNGKLQSQARDLLLRNSIIAEN